MLWKTGGTGDYSTYNIFNILQIFTESLLCSGREANIHLASQVLTLTPSPSHSTKQLGEEQRLSQGFTYRLPYESSIQLVLKSSQEYFNSTSGFMDTDMDLARLAIYVLNYTGYGICSTYLHAAIWEWSRGISVYSRKYSSAPLYLCGTCAFTMWCA